MKRTLYFLILLCLFGLTANETFAQPTPNAGYLGVRNVSQTSVDIYWANGGGDGYHIFVSTVAPDGAFRTALSTTDPTSIADYNGAYAVTNDAVDTDYYTVERSDGSSRTLTITGLSPGTTYYVGIYAFNLAGPTYFQTADRRNETSFTTAANNITVNNATSVGSTEFTADWNAGTGADGYDFRVQQSGSNITNYNDLDVGSYTDWYVYGLTADNDYTYSARSYSGRTTGAWATDQPVSTYQTTPFSGTTGTFCTQSVGTLGATGYYYNGSARGEHAEYTFTADPFSSASATVASYSWNAITEGGATLKTGTGGTTSTATYSFTTTGTKTLSCYITDDDGNIGTITEQITVNAAPTPTWSAGPGATCVGSTETYTIAGVTNVTSWTITTGTSGTDWTMSASTGATNDITFLTTGNRTIRAVTNDGGGCETIIEVDVTVNALPTPTITGVTETCVDGADDSYTTEAGMATYAWSVTSSPNGLGTDYTINAGTGTTTRNFDITYNVRGTFELQVDVVDGNGCTASATATVTVHDVTGGSITEATYTTADAEACTNGSDLVFTMGSLATGGTYTYDWTVSPSTGVTITGDGTSIATVSFANSGDYTVTCDVGAGTGDLCTETYTYAGDIGVYDVVTGTTSGSTTWCVGDAANTYSIGSMATLPTHGGATGYSYDWDVTPITGTAGATFGTETASSTTITFPAAGTYGVTVDVTAGAGSLCSYTHTVGTVTVGDVTGGTVTETTGPSATTFCVGGTALGMDITGLATPPTGVSYTYIWSCSPGVAGTDWSFSDNTAKNPTLEFLSDGAYNVQVIVTDGTCTQTYHYGGDATADITVNDVTGGTITAGDNSECINNNILFGITGLNGSGHTYDWDVTPVSGTGSPTFSAETGAATTIAIDAPGVYTVSVDVTSGACTDTYTYGTDITIYDVSITDVQTTPTTSVSELCKDESAQFVVNGLETTTGGTYTYAWNVTGGTYTIDDATAASPTVTFTGAGTYDVDVTITSPDGSCNDTYSYSTYESTIDVYDVTGGSVTGEATACVGAADPTYEVTGLSASPAGVTYTYDWNVTGGTAGVDYVINNENSASTTITWNTADTYTVECVVGAGTGDLCTHTYTYGTTTVGDVSTGTVAEGTSATTYCVGDPALTFSVTGLPAGGTYTYDWAVTGASGPSDYAWSDNTAAAPTLTFDVAGTYGVQVTVDDGTCNNTFTYSSSIDVGKATGGTVTASADYECVGQTLIFDIAGITGTTVTYDWNTSGGTPSFGTENASTTTISFADPGSYTVSVDVTSDGCTETYTYSNTVDIYDPSAGTVDTEPTGGVTEVCTGTAQGFEVTGLPTLPVGQSYTYNWFTTGGSPTYTAQTSANTDITFTAAGTFGVYLEVTAPNSACSHTYNYGTVTVNENSTDWDSHPTTTCSGSTETFSVDQSNTSYAWSVTPGTYTGTLSGQSVDITFTAADTYTVEVTVDDGTCTKTLTETVVVSTGPTVAWVTYDDELCVDESFTYEVTSGYDTYTWTPSGTSGTDYTMTNPNPHQATITWLTDGSRTLDVQATSGGCTGDATQRTITVNANPSPTISGNATPVSGNSATYNTQTGMSGYLWSMAPSLGTINSPNSASTSIDWTSSGSTILSVQYDNANGCTGTGTYSVSVASPDPANDIAFDGTISDQVSGTSFDVTVQTQYSGGAAQPSSNVNYTISVQSPTSGISLTGDLTGTISPTMTQQTRNITLTSTGGTAITDVVLKVTATTGITADGTSNQFDLSVAQSQASNIQVTDVQREQLTVSWTNGNATDATLIMCKEGASPLNDYNKPSSPKTASGNPVWQSDPLVANSVFGSGTEISVMPTYEECHLVYRGTGTTVTVTSLEPNTNYWFGAFGYVSDGVAGDLPAEFDGTTNTASGGNVTSELTENKLGEGFENPISSNGVLQMYNVYPNPANEYVTIDIQLLGSTPVTIQVYDLEGNTIMVPVNGIEYGKGSHSVRIPVADLTSGRYSVTISAGNGLVLTSFVVAH